MVEQSYLQWLAAETGTEWWHDSADLGELKHALEHGACGVTTNPVLTAQAVRAHAEEWREAAAGLVATAPGVERAETLVRVAVTRCAALLASEYVRSEGRRGYVCGQVSPSLVTDAEGMLAMARRYHAWAPNVAVKIPATAVGLDAIEECAAEGITTNATVSFTVPQALAVAERCRKGLERARAAGRRTGRCYTTIMIGRLDDYLRDVAADTRAGVAEEDIRQAGLAVTKRAYALYKERGYESVLVVAALRGVHHMVGLAGAEVVMSIHPDNQAKLLAPGVPRELGCWEPVPPAVIERLRRLPEFTRAYEPEGLRPDEFYAFGLTQRTLVQFVLSGWALLEAH